MFVFSFQRKNSQNNEVYGHHAHPKMSFNEESLKHAFTKSDAEDTEQETTLVQEGSWRFQKSFEVAFTLNMIFKKAFNNIHALGYDWILKFPEKF